MSFSALAKTTHTLAAAVADAATFTVAYPSGTTQATFTYASGGDVLVGENDVWTIGEDPGFAVSYGASNITVTNNTEASLAAGTELTLSFGEKTTDGSYNPTSPATDAAHLADLETRVDALENP